MTLTIEQDFKNGDKIDVFEERIRKYSPTLMKILLEDKTTKKNILWGTDDYKEKGMLYDARCEINMELITGMNSEIIQPRITKEKHYQDNRTKERAEVFTPSWLCNKQNNLVDEAWFGRKDVFNKELNKGWKTIKRKIPFSDEKNKTWKDYVDARRMEISCGEAPYLVSRYDTISGKSIAIKDRIGLLDRKLRVVNENTDTEEEWLKWTIRAFESIYGYEFQGDNLLLARENLFYTFIENFEFKWKKGATLKDLKKIANIIAWNIWQMDGKTYSTPYAQVEENTFQMGLFTMAVPKKDGVLCKIKDWRAQKTKEYKELVTEKNKKE